MARKFCETAIMCRLVWLPEIIMTRHNTTACKCNNSQFKMAQLDPPPCPVSPLLDFADPHVRLQSLCPGLTGNASLPQGNKPSVCTCSVAQTNPISKVQPTSTGGSNLNWITRANTDVLLSLPVAQVVTTLWILCYKKTRVIVPAVSNTTEQTSFH